MSRIRSALVLVAALLSILAGSFLAVTPLAAQANETPAFLKTDSSTAAWAVTQITFTPKTVPASQRRIEVVDQLKPSKWHVSQAVEWVDRYTASNMVTVSRCSGRAWKCVYIRGGKLGGNVLALTKGNTITVDYGKVDRRGYRSNYSRERILAHEIVHTFGYGHSFTRSNNLMRTTMSHVTLYLNSSERAYLHKR